MESPIAGPGAPGEAAVPDWIQRLFNCDPLVRKSDLDRELGSGGRRS